MAFLKHVGKHGDRKCAIIWREVPNEGHMCLVIYPETLPSHWEDSIMRVLESDVGQQAEQFADALHRSLLPDGRPILEALHGEKMIKKIRCNDVIVTPRAGSSIKLDELNKMLNEMKTGTDAIRRLAENDAARGMVPPEVKRSAEAAYKSTQPGYVPPAQASQNSALSDRDIAANMLSQALRMEIEAKNMIAEAARMKKDAERMDPTVTATAATSAPPAPPPKRGRPSKAKSAVADAAE